MTKSDFGKNRLKTSEKVGHTLKALLKAKGRATPSDFCRNLIFLRKWYTFLKISVEILDFRRNCRNLRFMQKGVPFLQKFKISADFYFCINLKFLQKGAHFLQISAEIVEILDLRRKCAPFCRFL